MTWSRPWAQFGGFLLMSAVGETLAHLRHLERRRRLIDDGDDPARWFLSAAR